MASRGSIRLLGKNEQDQDMAQLLLDLGYRAQVVALFSKNKAVADYFRTKGDASLAKDIEGQ
jgi:ABC-type proline/glycine betaine transport system ATPase subunit